MNRIRRINCAFALVAVMVPLTAHAQSTLTLAELQQLGQQYAQRYGVPWSIFEAQIQAESGWNPNVGCNSSGACGIAQFVPSTAAAFGIDPNNPQQALQAAAQYDEQLYEQDGSWSAALTAYSGGLTPANPGDYGPVFAAAASGDGGAAQQPGITVTADPSDGSIGAAAAAAGITPTASGTNLGPYTYLYNSFATSIANPLENELTAIQQMIQPFLGLLLVVMLITLGIGTWRGVVGTGVLLNRTLRMAAVVAFVGVGSSWYSTYILSFFSGLPTLLSNAILAANSTNPAAGFDAILHSYWVGVLDTWWALPFGVTSTIVNGFLLGLGALVLAVFTSLMFTVWMIAQALLALLLTIGPLIFLALLFDQTQSWFYRWLNAATIMVFAAFAADLLAVIIFKLVLNYINTLPSPNGGNASQNTFGLFGVAAVVTVLSFSIAYLPRIFEYMGAAVGIPSMAAARSLITGAGHSARTAATGAVAALVG